MMFFYNSLLCFFYPLLWLVSRFHKRLGENFALRAHLPDFAAAKGKTHIWFHASSAGEFEQVRAVAVEFKKNYPQTKFFFSFSFFSDSAYRAKKNDSIPDILFALPFDFSWRMKRLVRAMRPDALVIGKYDAWANQVLETHYAGVPVYLVSATLPEASKRYQWPLKNFLHRVYAPMRQIFAINEEHAERLRRISPLNVSIAGDTRFDAIRLRLAEGKEKQKQIEPIRRLFVGRKIIVGGSTYAASEKIILEYLHPKPTVQKKPVVAILAPHHVHEARISSIEALCHNFSLTALRLSQVGQSSIRKKIDVLIVDSLGVLPHLYPLADVAYVGGGFEGSVHSVIEAALAGVAVVTGPFIQNSAEAMDLQREYLLVAMEKQSCTLFAQIVENLCINKIKNARKAAAFAKERVGASQKIMHTVMDDISVNSMLA